MGEDGREKWPKSQMAKGPNQGRDSPQRHRGTEKRGMGRGAEERRGPVGGAMGNGEAAVAEGAKGDGE